MVVGSAVHVSGTCRNWFALETVNDCHTIWLGRFRLRSLLVVRGRSRGVCRHARPMTGAPHLQPAQIARWADLVTRDAEYRTAARWTALHLRLESGEDSADLYLGPSGISPSQPDTRAPFDTVLLAGSPAAWKDFLTACPLPPNHSILGMERRREDFQIIANRHHLVRNLRALTIALDLMRTALNVKADMTA